MGELHHKIISLVNSYVNILIYPLSKLLALPFISKKSRYDTKTNSIKLLIFQIIWGQNGITS